MRNPTYAFGAVALLVAVTSTACANSSPVSPSALESPSSENETNSELVASTPVDDLKILADNNNAFALDLYGRLSSTPGNIFFSPYSISTALAMTYAGARENTEIEMAAAMRYTLGQKRLHPAFAKLQSSMAAIQSKGDVELAVANALWPEKSYRFLPEFIELNRRYYGVEITPLDYIVAPNEARVVINTSIAEKTKGKIRDLIPEGALDDATRLVLTNAIYFKGFWLNQFKKSATRIRPFHLNKSATVEHPMMTQVGKFFYSDNDRVQVAELPYKGNDLSMIILLPREIDGLAAVESGLTIRQLTEWTSGMQEIKLDLLLPKFEMTSQFSLPAALKALGMRDAFSHSSDFSGMDGTKKLLITDVIHKAFVAVDEEGTEAAAATAVVVGIKSLAATPEPFHANHPFLFFIRDNRTGSILFLGRVTEPKP